jgi:hypothetical protein
MLLKDLICQTSGPGGSVGIATELRAERSGIESRLGTKFSTPIQTGPEAQPASYKMSTGSLSRG